MKWFKHDSDASLDTKLKRVRNKYGMEGYGLYWYCLEMIAKNVTLHNLTFELEDDAELISLDTGIHQERVQDMMMDFVKWGLFENSNGNVTCMKMLKRIDPSMSGNPKFRKILTDAKQNHDIVMTESCRSHDPVMIDKKRKEKNISAASPIPVDFDISESVKEWADKNGFNRLDEHLDNFVCQSKAKGYKYKDWDSAFRNAIRKNWANLSNGKGYGDGLR